MKNEIEEFRDAVILWLVSDAALVTAGALIAYTDALPAAIRIAALATAITLYVSAAGLLALSAVNVTQGWRALKGGNDD